MAGASKSTGQRIRFSITDTGIGIGSEQEKKLFHAFSQTDTSTTRRFGGTGLGLRISKALAQMLGGDITLCSNPGQGTTFHVFIATGPLDGVKMLDNTRAIRKVDEDVVAVERQIPVKLHCNILLAEDGPDNQKLISLILRKAGAEVTIAENGQIAYDMVSEALK